MAKKQTKAPSVTILGAYAKTKARQDFLKRWTAQVFAALAKRKIMLAPAAGLASVHAPELTISLIGEKKAKELNKSYRKKDYATDVLSFEDGMGLGDLVICYPVIVKQAKEHGLTINEELGYMVLHGILHLLGYDHEKSDKEARAMYRLQDSIFAELTAELDSRTR